MKQLGTVDRVAMQIVTSNAECRALVAKGRLQDAIDLSLTKAKQHCDALDASTRAAMAEDHTASSTPSEIPGEPDDVRIANRARQLLEHDAEIAQLVAVGGKGAGVRRAILKAAKQLGIRDVPAPRREPPSIAG